jgi:alpha-glucosidase
MLKQHDWLKGAVIYQIYPRSFKDSDGSGVGDLQGIISKLDYLAGKKNSLGVTGIWMSPINPSPMADFGYDVSDYSGIDPLFGKLSDLKQLVTEAHKRDLKVMMDFVPNHTSNEHIWFKESASSLDNPKRDWYTWRDPTIDKREPNNWLSVFGGSAWEYSDHTKQYYLHTFLSQQPDLNWDNKDVRAAMKDAMRFWLDIGVDGFRVDAVDWLSKDSMLRDDPRHSDVTSSEYALHYSLIHRYSRDGPHLFERLKEMTDVLAEYENRFMVVEAHPETADRIKGYQRYYDDINPGYCAPFNFEILYMPWRADSFKTYIDKFQEVLKTGYTPIYTFGNHDESRLATRVGIEAARSAAVLLLTLPGVAFIYYGEELGMSDVEISQKQTKDPSAIYGKSRDPERTPMQWDDSQFAGFSTTTPWLPLSYDHKERNVAHEELLPDSFLALYKKLINLRKTNSALHAGKLESLESPNGLYVFKRTYSTASVYVYINFTNETKSLKPLKSGILLASSNAETKISERVAATSKISLQPHEAIIIDTASK